MLAEDPLNRAPRIWEAIYPRSEHRAAEFGAGRGKVALQLRIFNRLSPGIRNLHPIEADAPEECIEITSQVFRSPRYDDVYRAPSYRAWLDASGFDEGYQFLARFLRHLQGRAQPPRRWILKSPEHVFSIDALTRVFPDAKLVFVHRDPGHVLGSAARLTELLRAPFTTAIDRREIGRKVADYWQDGMQRMVKVADDVSFPLRSRLVHVQYRSLVSDPVGTIAQIYNAFGLEFSQEAREAMSAKVAQAPNGGYGANRYLPRGIRNRSGARARARLRLYRALRHRELAVGLRQGWASPGLVSTMQGSQSRPLQGTASHAFCPALPLQASRHFLLTDTPPTTDAATRNALSM